MTTKEEIKERLKKKLDSLPSAQKEKILELARDESKRAIFGYELKAREKFYPLKNFIPNVAQERSLKCYAKPGVNPDYPYPIYNFFTGANDIGKTLALTSFLGGCTLGNEYLNSEWFGYSFFDMMQKRRKERSLVVWLVCENEDMSESGSLYCHISKWIPTAKFSAKKDGQFYKRIDIPAPKNGYHKTTISVKTFDQVVVKFSGTDCDVILINEPLPDEKKFDELVGRIRGGGYIAGFFTPLSGCAYIKQMIDDKSFADMLCHTKGNIWENCKDIDGMRGHISRPYILAQMAKWKKNPITFRARTEGEFVHLSGAVFPIFRNNPPHVITADRIHNFISKDDYVVQAVDHHPSKPDVSVWMKIDPLNNWHVIAEYPTENWDELETDEKSIMHYGYDFKLLESGAEQFSKFWYMAQLPKIQERIGDPNAFKAKESHGKIIKTIQEQYEDDCGLVYDLNVDNSISLRHDEISKLLYFDITREINTANSPKLYVYDTCVNVISALQYYLLGDNGKPLEEWKHWIDCIGYIVTTIKYYSIPNTIKNGGDDEFAELYGGTKTSIKQKKWTNGYTEVVDKPTENKKYDMYSVYGMGT